MFTRSSLVFSSVLVGIVVVGCNAILDNQPGTLSQGDQTSVTPTEPSAPPPSGPTAAVDAGPHDSGTPTDSGSPGCKSTEHMCNGQCVSNNDPIYGCGSPSCAPCALAHASAACAGSQCVIAACDPGYADCDLKAATGCEGDLSQTSSCGTCNTTCPPSAPLCAPGANAGTFACSTGCTPAAPLLCGATCVDPMTSDNNCGGCNVKCPMVDNGTAVCNAGACGFTCKAGFHACGNKCAADTDVKACGAACTVCQDPPHGTAACNAGACAFTCKPGFGDCDLNPATGCEAEFAKDNANCGACGVACAAGTTCKAGACVATPDGG